MDNSCFIEVSQKWHRERTFSDSGGGIVRAPLAHDWPGTFRQSSVWCGGMRLCLGFCSRAARLSFILLCGSNFLPLPIQRLTWKRLTLRGNIYEMRTLPTGSIVKRILLV